MLGVAISIGAVIYILVSHSKLNARISELEASLRKLSGTQATRGPWAATSATKTAQEKPAVKAAKAAPPQPAQPMRVTTKEAAKTTKEPVKLPATPMGPTVLERFFEWLYYNWFYAVSAVSLALAGLFFVQYGMENGFLPPVARVLAALGFGAALIAAGEYIRRRFGEAKDSATEYLPSVFAGAGIVSLFGGVLSAEMLYGLISPNMALVGMVFVALVALVLGWFYGALLAAVGIIGAFGAPMILGGSDTDPTPLFGYYAIVAAVGLGMDTLRRWAWVSVLTLVLAFVMGWLLVLGGPNLIAAFSLYVSALAVMAVVIPARSFWPDHGGVLIASFVLGRSKGVRPTFPTVLSAGAIIVTSVLLVLLGASSGKGEFWVIVSCASLLSVLFILWSVRAHALQDQVIAPIAALLGMVVMHANVNGQAYANFKQDSPTGETAVFSGVITTLVAIGIVINCLAAWRGLKAGRFGLGWAGVAALSAPALAILLEMTWRPANVIGAYPWALHGAFLACVMAFWAERFAQRDGPERRLRMSLFVLSALASMTFALVVIFSLAALTAALVVTVVIAALLDRKFNLRAMSYFIGAGVVAIGYRLVVDPGLDWALDAPIWEVLLSHGGAVAGFVATLFILPKGKRSSARVMLDSAAWSGGGILVSILLMRFLDAIAGNVNTRWDLGIFATIWLGLALAQLQRLAIPAPRWGWWVRVGLSVAFGAIGLFILFIGMTLLSPLTGTGGWFGSTVMGPPVLNTLIVTYLFPAAVLALGIWRIKPMAKVLRWAMHGLVVILGVYWLFCTIRHFWQGAENMPMGFGMSQPELYSYTIVLLVTGAGLFYQSLARSAPVMRKAGLFVIGLAVAKVFLIDISGLEGLTRVFSLLVLGLSLAGLAWLNRWAQDQTAQSKDT